MSQLIARAFLQKNAALLISAVASIWISTPALAHVEKPVWALNPSEQAELRQNLETSQSALIQALTDATEYRALEIRGFFHDSESELAKIPRSVLNRVLQHSLDLETAQMKSYLFCEAGCSHSAKQDGLSDSELKVARGLWPKIQSSFALVFREIPHGAWLRTIHFMKYSRSIGAKYHYQKSAYGRFALLAGATAFTGAFVSTEIAESLFMGPLHIVCQANYLWSLAFASTIASLSRDVKAALAFNSKHESLFNRLFGAYGRYSLLRRERALENRILIQSSLLVASGESAASSQTKLTRREAQIQTLTPILEAELEAPIRRSLAMDSLLWSELVTRSGFKLARPPQPGLQFSEAWDQEFENLKRKSPDEVRLWWRDLHASLRTLLRLQVFQFQAAHTLGENQKTTLRNLGTLDRSLRLWDTTVILALKTQTTWNHESLASLRSLTGEWLSLLISIQDQDLKTFELRQKYMEDLMKLANRSGAFKPSGTESLPATDRLARAVEVRGIKLCEGSFVPVR